jgi:hypothetical protein
MGTGTDRPPSPARRASTRTTAGSTEPAGSVRGHEKVPGYGHLRSPLVATKVPAFGHEKSPPLTEVST